MNDKAKINHCPYCQKDIKSGAINCIHCLSALLSLSLKIVPAGTRKFQHTVHSKRRMTYVEKKIYRTSDYQGAKAD